jgi:sigma54-dependent transcription regulator
MTDSSSPKDNFLFPRSKYWGEFTPQQLAFNANLQEFAQRVSFVCNLETGGKMTADDAYNEIKRLWKDLKRSKANLLDSLPPELPDSDSSAE